jgi:tripartite-type tricarboxylate transporter receptor subunit TctC
MITPNSAGSGTDIVARKLAEKRTASLGQADYVENIPGAGGIIGTETLFAAPKNGYTLSLVSSNHVVFPHLHKSLRFHALNDITPIAMLVEGPLVVVAKPDFPANGAKQLKALAHTRRITMGSAGNGSTLHLVGIHLQKWRGSPWSTFRTRA